MTRRTTLPKYDAPDPVIRAAADWLARRDDGLTPTEQAAFDRWTRADVTHASAVAQLERAVARFDQMRVLLPEAGDDPDPDFFAPPRRRRWPLRRLIVMGGGLAAAAALALMFFRPATAPMKWQFSTAAAQYDHATLIDGSTVDLNGSTELRVEFTAGERRVWLVHGEARFQVAKNPNRPFVVQADGVEVRAVGTAFNVRLASSEVEVLVTEGKVRVEHNVGGNDDEAPRTSTVQRPEIPLLLAGQRIVVSTKSAFAAPSIFTVGAEEMASASVWPSNIVEFSRKSLGEIVTEFNRHNRQKILIGDENLASMRIGGSFRTDQPDAFVRLLESSFGISATRSSDAITLRSAP